MSIRRIVLLCWQLLHTLDHVLSLSKSDWALFSHWNWQVLGAEIIIILGFDEPILSGFRLFKLSFSFVFNAWFNSKWAWSGNQTCLAHYVIIRLITRKVRHTHVELVRHLRNIFDSLIIPCLPPTEFRSLYQTYRFFGLEFMLILFWCYEPPVQFDFTFDVVDHILLRLRRRFLKIII